MVRITKARGEKVDTRSSSGLRKKFEMHGQEMDGTHAPVRHAHVGSWAWDLARGRVRLSREMCNIFGVTPVALGAVERSIDDLVRLVHPDDRSLVDDAVARTIDSGRFDDLVYRIVTAAGDVRALLSRGDVLFDASGRPTQIVGIAVEITPHDELEETRNEPPRRENEAQLDVASAELRVRTAIASDLHDIVGQLVAGAKLLTENVMHEAPKKLHPRLGRVANLLREALEKVRSISQDLTDTQIVEAPLEASLHALVDQMRALSSVSFSVVVAAGFVEPSRREKNQAFLVAREAILNATRHGRCSHVYITLGSDAGANHLSVSDDGIGFAELSSFGVGIASMQYRARLVGGQLVIGRGPYGGAEVLLRWPVTAAR